MAVAAALTEPQRAVPRRGRKESLGKQIFNYLPRGNLLSDETWAKRQSILQWFLLLHIPVLILFGLYMGHSPLMVLVTVSPFPVFWLLAQFVPAGRRVKSFFTTAGILYGAAALVVLANGAIEAHFDFFIVIGFIALYQDWVPFGWEIAFTVLSHGIGSAVRPNLMFDSMSGMAHPWRTSFIHGFAVLLACIGVVLFWRTNEDEQQKALTLTEELNEAEINRRKFTSDLLVNLARRNQSMLYRQLDIINQLEEKERDPDALAELFRLDHLATRIRRNAENLLVLSGEEPPRVWGKPVALTDVVRAAIAETEDLSRVTFVVDERLALVGQAVIDVTHLLAELIENAVRSSPPESRVTVRTTPDVRAPGSLMLTVEDWGVGMPPDDLGAANELLAQPRDVDAMVSNRLGLLVVARLAHRYSIKVMLTTTSGSGITAVLLLPQELLTSSDRPQSGQLPSQFTPVAADPRALPAPKRRLRPPPPVEADPMSVTASGSTFNGPSVARTGPIPTLAQPVARSAPQPALPPIGAPVSQTLDKLSEAPNWDGWWDPEEVDAAPAATPAAATPTAAAPPAAPPPAAPAAAADRPARSVKRPAPAAAATPAGGQPALRLVRRTPQAHLAPELHRDRQSAAQVEAAAKQPAAPAPDAARAREALSRYQASRQAALAKTDTAERNRP